MLGDIGKFTLIFSMLAGFANLFAPSIKKIGGKAQVDIFIFSNFFAQFFFNIISFGLLLAGFLSDDFSISTVYLSSNLDQPILYKIAASWANHEGSLLLWECLLTSISMGCFFQLNKKYQWRFEFLFYQSIISTCFLSFIVFASNPFLNITPKPLNGLGLNPILQDFALAIHPPILFASYASFSLVYSLSIIMLKNNISILDQIKSITRISFTLISTAIALGSWWAYRELGWGGFWFWDPVENSSLMPWLLALALLHSLTYKTAKHHQKTTSLMLSIFVFLSCLLATFLVRSGILSSVHSFAADSSKGIYILMIIVFIAIIPFYYMFKQKSREKSAASFSLNNECLVMLNIIILITSYATVLLGTLYPLIYQNFSYDKITIGEQYFNNIAIILSALLLVLMLISNFSSWHKTENTKSLTASITSLILSFIIMNFLSNYTGDFQISSLVLLTFSLALIISMLFTSLELVSANNWDSLKKKCAMYLGHLGFALLIIAIIIQYEKGFDDESIIKIGETKTYNDEIQLKLDDIARVSHDNYKSVVAKLIVKNNLGKIGILEPEMRFYPEQNIKTNEVSILHFNLINDLYSTIEKLDDLNYVYLRTQYKPLIGIVWLAALLIAFSGLIRFKEHKNEY